MSNRVKVKTEQLPQGNGGRSVTVALAKRTLRMKDPMGVEETARALRLRYFVVRRLVISGKLRSKKLQQRYFIERADVERAARDKPWAPWAMRKFKPAFERHVTTKDIPTNTEGLARPNTTRDPLQTPHQRRTGNEKRKTL